MSFEERLLELGYCIEPIELDTGLIMRGVRSGNLIFTSGQVSSWEGKAILGRVGSDLNIEEAREAALFSTLNCLRVIKTLAGSLDNVVQFVKVLGMVNASPDFYSTSDVINGCTHLLLEVFGDVGRHARSAVGLTIPRNHAVEIEMIVEVKE